jgi:RNA 2',3'-cyclic 3'-phosphodiesterase
VKRIFIGIGFEEKQRLRELVSSLRSAMTNESVKWTDPDNIHITLAFLGNTDENSLPVLADYLRENCESSGQFELLLKGLGLFKNIRDPKILWTGIEQSAELKQLHVRVQDAVLKAGLKTEDRPFSPHVTLGRIRSINDRSLLGSILNEFRNTEIQKIHVGKITLFESILGHEGSIYNPLKEFRL